MLNEREVPARGGDAAAALAEALPAFDCAALGIGKRIPFWLNAYNALVLHAVAAQAVERSVRDVPDFFAASAYRVSGRVFSLDDIEHGLLRANAPRYGRVGRPLAEDDPRLELAPFMLDERVHFAMHSACRGSPRLRVYPPDTFAPLLESAAGEYVAAHARLEPGGRVLRVPKLFQWYAADFGGEPGVAEFVLARLPEKEAGAAGARPGELPGLRYEEFDWRLNAPG